MGGANRVPVGSICRNRESANVATRSLDVIDVSEYHPPRPSPDGESVVEICFDDPFPACHGVAERRRDYDTEPVMAYANDPHFAA